MSGKDATMSAKDATRSAKAATSAADAGTSAAALRYTIAYPKCYQAPHPRPLRKPSPSLVSRFQHKYPDYHLWEKMLYFFYNVPVRIQLCSHALCEYSTTFVLLQYNLQRHVDGLGVQLVPIPLVSSIFIITFSPYLYVLIVYTY